MMSKTIVIVKAKDGRQFEREFDTYDEATAWISAETKKNDISLVLEYAAFDREQTIEVYKEKP